jgi:hypothetical protein
MFSMPIAFKCDECARLIRVADHQHFTHGCALPGIVLSVEKELIPLTTKIGRS